ncbi:aspartate aminotransferase family protein [Virgibacillus sp. W0181]|uniref:aspartate aminotransferase family protein n=1 Tax=Virgibacillus sp. W0181 TaxID=3391581 RepID=UPI003F44F501
MKYSNSKKLYESANKYTPGGVHTAMRDVNPRLVFLEAKNAYIYDADKNKYIDYQMAFGPTILGHNYNYVNERVIETINRTDLYGIGTTDLEIELSEKICKHIPSSEKVLFCNAGSEATYHSIRLARAITEKSKIIKFQGSYHGWHDYVAKNMQSSWEKIGEDDPGSAGMLKESVDNTLICQYNNLEDVKKTFQENYNEIAAIIVEPIAHSSGCIMPQSNFLEGLRQICTDNKSLLIFDEIVTGFRHDLGGYQKIANVIPDLTTIGKAMANGYPIAAIAGKEKYMNRFNTKPGGDVWFAGTFNGHAVGTAASIATIEVMEKEPVHEHIFDLGNRMRKGLEEIHNILGISSFVAGYGSIFSNYFMDFEPKSYSDLQYHNKDVYIKYREELLKKGIFKLPQNMVRDHICYSHTKKDIDRTLELTEYALKKVLTDN